MSEVIYVKNGMTDCLNQIIIRSQSLATQLKRAKFGERNNASNLIEEIIVVGYCAMYFSHMTESDLEEIVENTLEYFKTGLYDTDKISHIMGGGIWFHVRAWVYTPETHNDAGYWFHVYTFGKIDDGYKCISMLKEIESELKRIY